MSNLLGTPDCYGFPVRAERPNALEYTAAEYWVRESYRRYFQAEGGIPQLTTWQLERFFTAYNTGDPVLEATMAVLESDFRNAVTVAVAKRFASMLKNGASSVDILTLLREAGPGGDRKPDMLGISAGRTLLFDSVEVGTDKTAQSTFVELNEKMKILTTAVIPVLKLRLQALQAQYARGFTSVNVPSDFVVRASPFRLKTFEMIMPLPVRVNKKGGTVTVDWVCYHPTTTWLPDGVTPAPGSGAPTGTDGMVIYHIHQSVLPELPKSIRDAIAKELNRWKQESGYVLELNPALTGAFVTEKSSWSPEARQLFAYFGVGALVLMFLAVGWELGVVAGGVALAEAGLTALAATPAALVGAIRVTAALASQCWPAAVGAAPLIPLGAR